MNSPDIERDLQDMRDLLTAQNDRINQLEDEKRGRDADHKRWSEVIKELTPIISEQDRKINRIDAWMEQTYAPKAAAVIAAVRPNRKTAAQVIADATGEGMPVSLAQRLATREFIQECETDTDRMIREIETGDVNMNDWVPEGDGVG